MPSISPPHLPLSRTTHLLAEAELRNSFVPPTDDLPDACCAPEAGQRSRCARVAAGRTDAGLERRATVARAVELGSGEKSADVVHRDRVSACLVSVVVAGRASFERQDAPLLGEGLAVARRKRLDCDTERSGRGPERAGERACDRVEHGGERAEERRRDATALYNLRGHSSPSPSRHKVRATR